MTLSCHLAGVELRQARARLRLDLRTGRRSLRDVLMDPPAEAQGLTLVEVAGMVRVRRRGAGMEELGRRAVRDGVNLMLPVGRASLASRAWVADNALAWVPGGHRGARGRVAT